MEKNVNSRMQAVFAVRACVCGSVIMALDNDKKNGLVTEEYYKRERAYFKGRADAYREMSKMLPLLDYGNITYSQDGNF